MKYNFSLTEEGLRREISLGNDKEYRSFIRKTDIPEFNVLTDKDDYFKRWLQCIKKPSGLVDKGSIRVVDLFCGCGDGSLPEQQKCEAKGLR